MSRASSEKLEPSSPVSKPYFRFGCTTDVVQYAEMGVTTFPSDITKVAEMEFYLLEELDFHLIIYHPYRSLVQLCGRDGGPASGGEVGQEQREYMLEMDDTALQMAW